MECLPKYYFQDLPAAAMSEIYSDMAALYPESSWEEIDAWLNAQHASSTIPDWYERAEQFISDQRRVMA